MLLFHHEDQVGPFDLFGAQYAVRVRREAGGIRLDAGACEHALGGGARSLFLLQIKSTRRIGGVRMGW